MFIFYSFLLLWFISIYHCQSVSVSSIESDTLAAAFYGGSDEGYLRLSIACSTISHTYALSWVQYNTSITDRAFQTRNAYLSYDSSVAYSQSTVSYTLQTSKFSVTDRDAMQIHTSSLPSRASTDDTFWLSTYNVYRSVSSNTNVWDLGVRVWNETIDSASLINTEETGATISNSKDYYIRYRPHHSCQLSDGSSPDSDIYQCGVVWLLWTIGSGGNSGIDFFDIRYAVFELSVASNSGVTVISSAADLSDTQLDTDTPSPQMYTLRPLVLTLSDVSGLPIHAFIWAQRSTISAAYAIYGKIVDNTGAVTVPTFTIADSGSANLGDFWITDLEGYTNEYLVLWTEASPNMVYLQRWSMSGTNTSSIVTVSDIDTYEMAISRHPTTNRFSLAYVTSANELKMAIYDYSDSDNTFILNSVVTNVSTDINGYYWLHTCWQSDEHVLVSEVSGARTVDTTATDNVDTSLYYIEPPSTTSTTTATPLSSVTVVDPTTRPIAVQTTFESGETTTLTPTVVTSTASVSSQPTEIPDSRDSDSLETTLGGDDEDEDDEDDGNDSYTIRITIGINGTVNATLNSIFDNNLMDSIVTVIIDSLSLSNTALLQQITIDIDDDGNYRIVNIVTINRILAFSINDVTESDNFQSSVNTQLSNNGANVNTPSIVVQSTEFVISSIVSSDAFQTDPIVFGVVVAFLCVLLFCICGLVSFSLLAACRENGTIHGLNQDQLAGYLSSEAAALTLKNTKLNASNGGRARDPFPENDDEMADPPDMRQVTPMSGY